MQNEKAYELVTTVAPDEPGIPAREWFTAYSALSLVTGLFCHHHSRNVIRKLDASVGASGPHGFTVRKLAHSSMRRRRPPHPAPNVRDDRETPLLSGAGWRQT
jgi:hypothetical protein